MNSKLISNLVLGVVSLLSSSVAFSAACSDNISPPDGACESLSVNLPNRTITINPGVTISGNSSALALIFNYPGAIGTNLINNGLLDSAFQIGGIYNAWVGVGTPPSANIGTITLLRNAGTISVPGHAILSRSTVIGSLVNSGSITSSFNDGIQVIEGGSVTLIENSGSITGGTPRYSLYTDSTSSIGSINNLSGGSFIGTLSNEGTISGLANAGTIQGVGSDGLKNSGLISVLSNTGMIRSFGMGGRYGIDNSGTITVLGNSGTLRGLNSGLRNVVGATIGSLTNYVAGGIGGGGTGIENSGSIQTLVNYGQISSAFSSGLYNDGTIGVLTNLGQISAPFGNMVFNAGAIATLNNLNAAVPLTYSGALPTNYNVIINSPVDYGKLSIAPTGGAINFGIYAGDNAGIAASTIKKGTYSSVLMGFSSDNLNNTTGKYNGFTWTLNNSAGNTWDLLVTGAPTADTQASLLKSALALQKVDMLQRAIVTSSLYHDCVVFDQNNVCVSAGGGYTKVDSSGTKNSSALVVAAYRPRPNYRLGMSLDQSVSQNGAEPVFNMSAKIPLIGIFGVWSASQDGSGGEAKISAVYGQKNTTVNREVVGDSEAGSGSSLLTSHGVQLTLKYGLKATDRILLQPYFGVRYSSNHLDGYSESASGNVTAPLKFASFESDTTTGLMGLEVRYRLSSAVALFAGAGVEHVVRSNGGMYSATGIDGLTAFTLNSNLSKTRAAASLSAYYDLDKSRRLGVAMVYRQEPSRSISSSTVMLTYTAGL